MSEPAFWISYCLLWVVVIGQTAVLLAFVWHYGNVLLNAPAGRVTQGPPEGRPLPRKLSLALEDRGVPIGRPDTPAKLLLFVMTTTCGPCRQARDTLCQSPEILSVKGVEIITVCWGSGAQVDEFSSPLPRSVRVIADPDGRLGDAFRLSAFPFAVLIDSTGLVRAKGMPAAREHFLALLENVPGMSVGSGPAEYAATADLA